MEADGITKDKTMKIKRIIKYLSIAYVASIIAYGVYNGVSWGGSGWAVGDVLLLSYLISSR